MLNFDRVLVVVAHPDDEVLGCGGTISRFVASGKAVHILILSNGVYGREGAKVHEEARRLAAAKTACRIMGATALTISDYPDNGFDAVSVSDIAAKISHIVEAFCPQLVITHHVGDLNQDHRRTHDATMIACRPLPCSSIKAVWTCEVPSATGWAGGGILFDPDIFVDISTMIETKRKALQAYEMEMRPWPHVRSIEACEVLARWRGSSVGIDTAESFMASRIIVS